MRLYTVLVVGVALAAGLYSDHREVERCRLWAKLTILKAMARSRS